MAARECVKCGIVDEDPRCVVDMGGGIEALWHMDCHFKQFGPMPCHQHVTSADSPKGDELRELLTADFPKE